MGLLGIGLHGAVAWLVFLPFLWVSLRPVLAEAKAGPTTPATQGGAGYALLMLAALVLFRWPLFFLPFALDPDEDQFIAGALTLLRDGAFWRSLDGQTAGPLIYYALVPLGADGLSSYAGARMVSCGLIFGALWFTYRGLRAVWGEALARVGVLPACCFLACTLDQAFVHYASEDFAIFLLAAGLAGVLTVMGDERSFRLGSPAWLGAGFALGAVPFTKLQAMPPAAVIFVGALAWALTRPGLTRGRRWQAAGSLMAALWVVPLAFAAMITASGAWESFWRSYIVDNLNYLDQTMAMARTISLWDYLTTSRRFGVFAASAVVAIMILARRWRRPSPALAWPVGLVVAMALASLPFTLITRRYTHYLLFLVIPLTLLAAMAVALRGTDFARQRAWWALLVLMVLPQVGLRGLRSNGLIHLTQAGPVSPGPLAREILRHAGPGDSLSIWGWHAEAHVQTGLPQGTSNSNAASQLTPGPDQAYFLRRYVDELERNRPRVFVDAVGRVPRAVEFTDRSRHAHERFPELRDYIAQHYEQQAEVEGARVYRRRP